MSQPVFTMDQTWLQCINCAERADLLTEEKFTCHTCGGLMEVRHNFKGADPDRLKWLFQSRGDACESDARYRLGVWKYKELINPFLPDEHIVTLCEGMMPVLPAGRNLLAFTGSKNLWIILEGFNPTGTFKACGMTNLISTAKAAGRRSAACASTGDTSAALAAYAAAAEMDCFVLLPEGKITMVQLVEALLHGATVLALPGDFDDCMRVMLDLVRDYGVYPANSVNPVRIEGHQVTVFRTLEWLGWELPAWFAVPVGNGSNISSIHKGMRTLEEVGWPLDRTSRILGCQSAAANPLSASWERFVRDGELTLDGWRERYAPIQVGETTATAARIGNPVSREKVMRAIIHTDGSMVTVPEDELNQAVLEAGRDGFNVCPQTGIAIAGVREAIARGAIDPDESVVVVSTATGHKFPEMPMRLLESRIQKVRFPEAKLVAKHLGLVPVA